MKIYHNPRCAKSREALALLQVQGHTPEIVLYLKDVPSKSEIRELLKLLKITAESLVRKTEKVFIDNYRGKTLTTTEWIAAMHKHPVLIQRPIVVANGKAVIARPPQKVEELL